MKLKQQITLLISLALIVPTLLISTLSIYRIQKKATADIEEFKTDEYGKLKMYLKHITDIAYGVIETRHKQMEDSVSHMNSRKDSTTLAKKFEASMLEDCLHELAQVRFDNNKGYFWVTDNRLPFPTMLMHAEKTNMKNQVLDDPKHNVEKQTGKNIYQARAELCNANGDAYVEYIMKKPGTDDVDNKISYSRLYKPLGWIVSTGFYTDQIEIAVAEKKEALTKQIKEIVFFITGISVFILALGLYIAFYFGNNLTKAILKIKDTIKELSLGSQVKEVNTKRKDEVGDMTHSLNSLVEGLRSYTSFSKEIGKGNLEQAFEPLSSDDVLGNELLIMRDNLKTAADEKNIRDWINEGLATMGEVMRRNNTNTKELAEEILRDLVKYLQVNQGALFVLNEGNGYNDRYLELMAAYAYEKRKHINKRIELGDGLAGQCVLERTTMHLREVPDNYIAITSGLGHSLPRSVVIVPLIHNEEVFGVIEMASFKTFDDHQISFIEKIAESIASTIASVQINERTKTLLEQSQQMSEELKAQEEELRQNQEELQATSEQMRRRQVDLEKENELLKRNFSERTGDKREAA